MAPTGRTERLLALVVVVTITFLSFLPALRNDLVNWDDETNFLENAKYRGLGWSNLGWMFTTFHKGPYQPLSWVTLGIDYLIWGAKPNPDPGGLPVPVPVGYHLTNLVIHSVNAGLCYWLILGLLGWVATRGEPHAQASLERGTTGEHSPRRTRPCQGSHERARQEPHAQALLERGTVNPVMILAAAVGALFFSIHPLRVESVVWATERRDVLSGLFFMLTVLAYLRMAGEETAGGYRRWRRLSVCGFALSLLSKASAATLPVALLVLDWYPLGRMGKTSPATRRPLSVRDLVVEKIPFLALALVAGTAAIFGQSGAEATRSWTMHTPIDRVVQACFGYCFYVWKTVVPTDLLPLYELEARLDPAKLKYLAGVAVFAAATAVLLAARHLWRAGWAAWAASVVLVAPFLGFFQSGPQIAADRYTYLAFVPYAAVVAGGVWWLTSRCGATGRAAAVVALIAPLLFGLMASRQTEHWRDSVTLWRYAIATGPPCSVAEYNLGRVYMDVAAVRQAQGQPQEAAAWYRRSLPYYERASALKPNELKILQDTGAVYGNLGEYGPAVAKWKRIVELSPDHVDALYSLGLIAYRMGRLDEAAERFRHVLRVSPTYANARRSLAEVLAKQGKPREAEAVMAGER